METGSIFTEYVCEFTWKGMKGGDQVSERVSVCACVCEAAPAYIRGPRSLPKQGPSLVQLLKLFFPKVTPPPRILSAQKLKPEVRRSVAWDGPPGTWSHREGGARCLLGK